MAFKIHMKSKAGAVQL